MIYQRLLIVCFVAFAIPLAAFDHEYQEYGKILDSYVKNGLVDYASLQKNRAGIDSFVKELSAVTGDEYQSWTRDQQLAFWINAYNGWFLKIVVDHYPIKSGRLIGVFYPENSVQRIPGIWTNITTKAAARQVSLNDIEHKILRPLFKEPRIHFAIVCASIGCPSLRSEPFLASSLDSQLNLATREFVNDPAKVRWNAEKKRVEISSIFNWFKEDFKNAGGPVAFIKAHAEENLAKNLNSNVRVEYLDYDWSLNEQK